MSTKKEPIVTAGDLNIKVYKKRWIVLAIFILYASMSAFQWIEYPIITNIVMRYYNVSARAVDWTSIVYMALFAPLVVPASYIIDKKGLRAAALIGGIGTALGTILKVFSVEPNRFWVVMLCQSILSMSQTVIVSLPPRIAAVWFPPDEVSTACALGVFGTQLGTAIGFVLPPFMVKNHDAIEKIGGDLYRLSWVLAGTMIPVTAAIIIFFPGKPPLPPSQTQLIERVNKANNEKPPFFQSLKVLMCNKPFLVHMVAYGINVAVFSAVGTYLNQYTLSYFPNSEEDAGKMGLLMVLLGMVGSIIFGVILDKTKKYKECTLLVYTIAFIATVAYMYSLEYRSKALVYLCITIQGFFTCAYANVGFELSTELTYPSPESTATGLLFAMTQVLGVFCTLFAGWLYSVYGSFWSIFSQAFLLGVGALITAFIPNKLKRQAAFREHDAKLIVGFERVETDVKKELM